MSDTTLWAELLAYGTGIGLSPIHIAVLLLLLLGPQPLRRGGWFVAGWVITTMATSALLVTVGHSLVLDMTQGSHHRTGLDLLAGGALIAVGGRELLRSLTNGDTPPAWSSSVDRFVNMPLPLHMARTDWSFGLHHRSKPFAAHPLDRRCGWSRQGCACLRTRERGAVCTRRAGCRGREYWNWGLSRLARNQWTHHDLRVRSGNLRHCVPLIQ